jgi:uncharacterized protein with PQ loop repeat
MLSSYVGFLAGLLTTAANVPQVWKTYRSRSAEGLSFRMLVIRLALGAEPSGVLWQVLRETLVLVSVGIAIGVPLALAGTQLVRGMLYGFGFANPVAILFAVISLGRMRRPCRLSTSPTRRPG